MGYECVTSDIYGAGYGHPVIGFTMVVRIFSGDLAADEVWISRIVGRVVPSSITLGFL